MKQKVLSITLFALLTGSMAQAMATTQDVPVTLNISGTVSNKAANKCIVSLSQSVINLTSSSKDMIKQGENATSPERLVLTVHSPDGNWTQCDKDVYDGKVAIKFTGTHDDADGTDFANTATGENAASGVGIGLFNYDNTPIDTRDIFNIRARTNISVNYLGLQLVQLAGQTVTSGTVAGNITFQIERL